MGKHASAKRSFHDEWRKDSKINGWVQSADNGTAVKCKFCNCKIRPHYGDLLKHSETKKKKKTPRHGYHPFFTAGTSAALSIYQQTKL
ncbi:unnamed protein product [Ixodes persulcatus]